MASKRKYFDLAIGEADGNGGDLAMKGNDLAVVYGNENQIYLALFGGNVEQDTPALITNAQTFDWWGNTLLFGNNRARQFNSKTERTLNEVSLNSSGRIKIESAVKDDLSYLRELGADVTVNVEIIATNTVKIFIKTIYPDGPGRITTITFGKRFTDGDFSVLDFNEDFL